LIGPVGQLFILLPVRKAICLVHSPASFQSILALFLLLLLLFLDSLSDVGRRFWPVNGVLAMRNVPLGSQLSKPPEAVRALNKIVLRL
jgi:hypothetical protein